MRSPPKHNEKSSETRHGSFPADCSYPIAFTTSVSRLKTFCLRKDDLKKAKNSYDRGGGDATAGIDFDDLNASTGLPYYNTDRKQASLRPSPCEVHSRFSETVPEREDEEEDEEDINLIYPLVKPESDAVNF